jgi:hypothetical protein
LISATTPGSSTVLTACVTLTAGVQKRSTISFHSA